MTILITGGSGAIGTALTKLLIANNHEVRHLSRNEKPNAPVPTFVWDAYKQTIDERCLDGVDAIVHLAGEGIADEKWTRERKDAIIKSRTDSSKLLFKILGQKKHTVKHFISSSAVGYYGNSADVWMHENMQPVDTGFLSYSCVLWEKSVDDIANLGIRLAKIRTGVVLDKTTGALPQMAKPIKLLAGAPLGSGSQYIPWIHIEDICRLYLFLIENENLTGTYNGVAPTPCTNAELTRTIGVAVKRPIWPINVPAFVLKLILGEMSAVVLNSNRVSADKTLSTGFEFIHTDVNEVVKGLLAK